MSACIASNPGACRRVRWRAADLPLLHHSPGHDPATCGRLVNTRDARSRSSLPDLDGDHREHGAMAAAPANECSTTDALVAEGSPFVAEGANLRRERDARPRPCRRRARIEVSHQPTRRRERHMQRFGSARHAQRFLANHSRIHNHFQLHRHRLSANDYRTARETAFRSWRDVVVVPVAV